MTSRIAGPRINTPPPVADGPATMAQVSQPKAAAPVQQDTFEAPRAQTQPDAAPQQQGFFSRVLSAIEGFFAAIWHFFTGGSTQHDATADTAADPPDAAARMATARIYAQQRAFMSSLHRQSTSATQRVPIPKPRPANLTSAAVGGSTSGERASSPAMHVMNELVAAGLSPNAAAAVASNINNESGFNPNAQGDHGTAYGICQWRGDRLAALRAFTGTRHPTLDQQLQFVVHEMHTDYPKLTAEMNASQDAGNAARMFEKIYERPFRHHPERVTTARNYLLAYSDSSKSRSNGLHG